MKTLRTKRHPATAGSPTGTAGRSRNPGSPGGQRLPGAELNRRQDMLNKTRAKRKLTRKEQRDLDIEIGFMEGVSQRDPKSCEAWRVLSEDYARRGNLEARLKADEQLARLEPNDPSVLYNLACSYSLKKQAERAVNALSRAVAKGFREFKWLLKDPELGHVRKNPLFKKVWTKISAVQYHIS
jgi:tetratricopeptide (TPR) repeat protein